MFLENVNKGSNQFWRYLAGIFIIVAIYFIASLPAGILMSLAMLKGADLSQFQNNFDFSALGINTNIGLIVLLLPSIASFFGMMLVARLHNRSFLSLLTAYKKIRWRRMFFGASIWLLLLIIAEFVAYFMEPGNYELNFNLKLFIPLVFISLLMIPLQAASEEILFRGYLMQGFAKLALYRWIPLIITAILFGLMHSFNPEVKEYGAGLTMPYYIGFGLLMGIIAIMDDGLEIPVGIHAINNIYGALFITFSGSALQTAAVFRLKHYDASLMLIMWVVIALIFLIIIANKFGWKGWVKIFRKIET